MSIVNRQYLFLSNLMRRGIYTALQKVIWRLDEQVLAFEFGGDQSGNGDSAGGHDQPRQGRKHLCQVFREQKGEREGSPYDLSRHSIIALVRLTVSFS